jgi:hypothetical protein
VLIIFPQGLDRLGRHAHSQGIAWNPLLISTGANLFVTRSPTL